jgi:hypothetical protein
VFEIRVLRRIFGPKRDEVMGKWRKLHNEELCDLYFSPSIIRITKSRRILRNRMHSPIIKNKSYLCKTGRVKQSLGCELVGGVQ